MLLNRRGSRRGGKMAMPWKNVKAASIDSRKTRSRSHTTGSTQLDDQAYENASKGEHREGNPSNFTPFFGSAWLGGDTVHPVIPRSLGLGTTAVVVAQVSGEPVLLNRGMRRFHKDQPARKWQEAPALERPISKRTATILSFLSEKMKKRPPGDPEGRFAF